MLLDFVQTYPMFSIVVLIMLIIAWIGHIITFRE